MSFPLTDPRTGKRAWISNSEAFLTELAAVDACQRKATELRLWTNSNGTKAAWHQCLACGDRRGNPQKVADRSQLPIADEVLWPAWREAVRAQRRALEIEYIDRELERGRQISSEYDAYLLSDAWKAKRQRVLSRCDGICEGCGTNSATQVHHLTYDHLFDEFLFELVGICEACHDRIHELKEGKMDEQAL